MGGTCSGNAGTATAQPRDAPRLASAQLKAYQASASSDAEALASRDIGPANRRVKTLSSGSAVQHPPGVSWMASSTSMTSNRSLVAGQRSGAPRTMVSSLRMATPQPDGTGAGTPHHQQPAATTTTRGNANSSPSPLRVSTAAAATGTVSALTTDDFVQSPHDPHAPEGSMRHSPLSMSPTGGDFLQHRQQQQQHQHPNADQPSLSIQTGALAPANALHNSLVTPPRAETSRHRRKANSPNRELLRAATLNDATSAAAAASSGGAGRSLKSLTVSARGAGASPTLMRPHLAPLSTSLTPLNVTRDNPPLGSGRAFGSERSLRLQLPPFTAVADAGASPAQATTTPANRVLGPLVEPVEAAAQAAPEDDDQPAPLLSLGGRSTSGPQRGFHSRGLGLFSAITTSGSISDSEPAGDSPSAAFGSAHPRGNGMLASQLSLDTLLPPVDADMVAPSAAGGRRAAPLGKFLSHNIPRFNPPSLGGGSQGALSPSASIDPHTGAVRHPVRCADLPARVEPGSSGEAAIHNEYFAIDRVPRAGTTVTARDHPALNRYPTILPFDQTRVHLSSGEYVNASNIDVVAGRQPEVGVSAIPGMAPASPPDVTDRSGARARRYIAAMGPLPGTVQDFWEMVWDNCTTTIVMMTREKENGKSSLCGAQLTALPNTYTHTKQ